MNGWRAAVLVARRDVAVEAAGRDGVSVAAPFVVAALLLAGIGFGPAPDVLRAVAPAVAWLVTLLAAAPLARGVAAAERDEACWDLLRGLVSPTALLTGKAAALWLWLVLTWAAASVLGVALFDVGLSAGALAGGVLGTLGLALVTAAFAVAVAAGPRRGGLLAGLILPAGLPVLLGGAQLATPGVPPAPWLALLAAYDAVIAVAAWALFPILMEE